MQVATSSIEVDAFALYQSERKIDGPRYCEISAYSLL